MYSFVENLLRFFLKALFKVPQLSFFFPAGLYLCVCEPTVLVFVCVCSLGALLRCWVLSHTRTLQTEHTPPPSPRRSSAISPSTCIDTYESESLGISAICWTAGKEKKKLNKNKTNGLQKAGHWSSARVFYFIFWALIMGAFCKSQGVLFIRHSNAMCLHRVFGSRSRLVDNPLQGRPLFNAALLTRCPNRYIVLFILTDQTPASLMQHLTWA